MGQLPASRVNAAPGFHSVGIDYAGPFRLKTSPLRKAPRIDGYLAIFVCFVTKGVHIIEVVTGLTTEAFLAAMKRFIGRRGLPRHVYSDNGGNFKGARNDLEQLYKWIAESDMTTYLRSFNQTT